MDFLLENEIVRKWKAGNFKKYKYFFGWMAPPPTVYISKDVLKLLILLFFYPSTLVT